MWPGSWILPHPQKMSLLPPEIWRRIIQEATSPGSLMTSWDYTPSEKLFRGWEQVEITDPSMTTKLSVILVCRRWRTIGVEFLYEWVTFKDPIRSRALSEALRASAAQVAAAEGSKLALGPAYGWWVRRVDVSGTMIEEEQINKFFDFLELCSRVEIVLPVPPYGSITSTIERRLTELQASRFQHSLRHLRLRAIR